MSEVKKRSVSTSYLEKIRKTKLISVVDFIKELQEYSKDTNFETVKDLFNSYAEDNKPAKNVTSKNPELVNKFITIFEEIVPMFGSYVSHRATPKIDNSYSVTIENNDGLSSKVKVNFTNDDMTSFKLIAGPWKSEIYDITSENINQEEENEDYNIKNAVVDIEEQEKFDLDNIEI